jgi:hypothetical protein
MKTRIVSVRIPAAQASGTFNISLPTGFGVPKGFLVYAQDNFVQPDNFDSTTDFPCLSVGFGGSNIAGTGLTNACAWTSNEEAADPVVSRASFGNTVSIFATNILGTIRRQWQLTGFAQDTILGTYQGVGTQQTPLDAVFTVFTGDDFFCAVGQTILPNGINTRGVVGTTFQPDAILYSHIRPAQTTDGQLHFGAAVRVASTGSSEVTSQVGAIWRNIDDAANPGSSGVTTRISDTGSFNLATNAVVRLHSMFSTGFAVTQSTANTGNSIIFLAMTAGFGRTLDPSFSANTFQSSTATGTSFYSTGFKPCHVLGCFSHSTTLNASNTTAANGCEVMSFFTANGLDEKNITGTGTITSNAANTSVSGTGTSFLSELGATDTLYDLNFRLVGIVSSITSNTALILQSNASTTVTSSAYEFQKSQQFSLSYGNVDNSAAGNDAMRGRVSTNGIVSFTATTPTIQAIGNIQNFTGENGFTVNYSTLANGGRYGWFLAIRDEDFYFRRRVINT